VYQNLYLSLVWQSASQPLSNVPAYLNTSSGMTSSRRAAAQESSGDGLSICMSRARDDVEDAPDDQVTADRGGAAHRGLVGKLLPAHEARAVIERYVYGHSTTEWPRGCRSRSGGARYTCIGLKRIREAVSRGRR